MTQETKAKDCCYGVRPLSDCQCEKDRLAALAAEPSSLECQSEIDKDLVRTYYGDLGAFYRVRAALAATPAVGGEARATAWRVWWVSLNTSRTELFENETAAAHKAREVAGCVIPLYAAQPASPLLADKPEVEKVRQIAFRLSAKQQYRLAFLISENIGYALKSNDPLAELSVNGHPLADRGDVA